MAIKRVWEESVLKICAFNLSSNHIRFWIVLDTVRCKTIYCPFPFAFDVCGLPTSKTNKKELHGQRVCWGPIHLSPGSAPRLHFWEWVSEKSCFPGCPHIKFWTPETFLKGPCPHQQPMQRTTLPLWSHAREFLLFSCWYVRPDHAALLRKTLPKTAFTGYHFHLTWPMPQDGDLKLKWATVTCVFCDTLCELPEPCHCTHSARVLHIAIICRVKISKRPQARADSLPSVICVSLCKSVDASALNYINISKKVSYSRKKLCIPYSHSLKKNG